MSAVATKPIAPTWCQVRARVVSQRDYGAGHLWLDLEVPAGFGVPEAGQFVQLLLIAPAPVLLPRPMSVAGVRRWKGHTVVGFLYRPVGGLLTWQLGWLLWGAHPLPYHALGLLIHAASALFLGLWLATVTAWRSW